MRASERRAIEALDTNVRFGALHKAEEVRTMELYTVPELAKYLKCSRQKVYQLVAERKVPFVKVEGSVRFQPEDIEAWLDSNKIAAS